MNRKTIQENIHLVKDILDDIEGDLRDGVTSTATIYCAYTSCSNADLCHRALVPSTLRELQKYHAALTVFASKPECYSGDLEMSL